MSTITSTPEQETDGRWHSSTAMNFLMPNIVGKGLKDFRIKNVDTGAVLANTVVGDGTKLDIYYELAGNYNIQWVDEDGNKFKMNYEVEAPDTWIRWKSIRAHGGYAWNYVYDFEPTAPPPEPEICECCGQEIPAD